MVTVSMKNKPLRQQLFIFFLAFNLLLLSLLWIFQTSFLGSTYEMIREKEVRKAIQLVGQHINSPDLPSLIQELEQSKNILVRSSKDFEIPYLLEDFFHVDLLPRTLKEDHQYTLKDGSHITLTFYAILSPVDATVSTLRFQLTLVSILMFILSTLAAIYLSKYIDRPISQLNQEAKNLARGQYQDLFKGQGYLEIKELSSTLNTTARDLSRLNQTRQDLLANVSHDLRTPLALIYSQAELMHDFPEEITPDQTEVILREVRRLSNLVSDLLTQSNLESGKMQMTFTTYSLTESVEKILHQLQSLLKNKEFSFHFSYDENCLIQADESKINQVIYNLLVNAIDHSPSPATIRILQEVKKDKVTLSISDQGPGIDAKDLPYIWDRYYQVDRDLSASLSSSGLGLAIVKNIVQAHQGQVTVSSTSKKGSTFTVELPLKQ